MAQLLELCMLFMFSVKHILSISKLNSMQHVQEFSNELNTFSDFVEGASWNAVQMILILEVHLLL